MSDPATDPTPEISPRVVDKPAKPTHYKIICISMYTQDIEELDAKIAELKRRGWSKVSKSQLIRIALSQLEVDDIAIPRA